MVSEAWLSWYGMSVERGVMLCVCIDGAASV